MFNKSKNDYQLLCKLDIKKAYEKIKLKPESNKTFIFLKYISDIPYTPDDSDDLSMEDNTFNDDIRVYVGDVDGLYDNPMDVYEHRIRNIVEFFRDKMIVLTPQVDRFIDDNNMQQMAYKGTDLHVLDVKNSNDFDEGFCSIPIFSNDNVAFAYNVDHFKEFLSDGKMLGSIDNPWPEHAIPEAIIWKDDSGVYVFTKIDKASNNIDGMSFKMSSFDSYKEPLSWLEQYYIVDDMAFIDKTEFTKLRDYKPVADEKDNDYTFVEPKHDIVNSSVENNRPSIKNDSTDSIFDNFKNCVKNKYHLTYDEKDLVNFHNSLKTNLLTVLAGISGTGKSKIVTAYADSLGVKNDEQFNMVSVRPFWQDDSDLLGFVDTISNTYHPGDSGVVDTLISAYKNRDKMYIIVFDEMNLARVEHYFSQFLSVLEKDPIDRKLQLYNKNLQARLYNGDQYPAELLIPENVRFVGTMNIDESTFQMSDKILDRANVITLKSVKFADRVNNNQDTYVPAAKVGYEKYESFIEKEYSFDQEQLQFFDELNSCINKQLPTVGMGWRTLNSIEKYVGDIYYHHYDNFHIEDAFDYQVAQRILPKVRGTELMLKTLLDPDNEESIYKVLDNHSDMSDFSFTRALLDKKNSEIEVIGFAN